MKFSWQILTLLLAVAVLLLSVKILRTGNVEKEVEMVDKQSVILENIMTRTSVRSYTSQGVTDSEVETLLKAGMAAPTAGNRQPWSFIVLNDRAVMDEIGEIIVGARHIEGAPLAIAVCGSPLLSYKVPLDEYWVQDCSAATENILLAAHAMGLGALWCGAYPNTEADRQGKLAKLLNLPQDVNVLSIIVVGHPDKPQVVKDKWKPEKVHYNSYE